MKRIEIWYTLPNGFRSSELATSLNQTISSAKNICKRLAKEGSTGINVDVTHHDSNGDLIENRSQWYSYTNGKLTKI